MMQVAYATAILDVPCWRLHGDTVCSTLGWITNQPDLNHSRPFFGPVTRNEMEEAYMLITYYNSIACLKALNRAVHTALIWLIHHAQHLETSIAAYFASREVYQGRMNEACKILHLYHRSWDVFIREYMPRKPAMHHVYMDIAQKKMQGDPTLNIGNDIWQKIKKCIT